MAKDKEPTKEELIAQTEDLSEIPDEVFFEIADNPDTKFVPTCQKQEMKSSKRTFRSIAKQLLALHPPRQVTNQILKLAPELRREDVDVRLAMLQMQILNALKGDAKAFEIVRDTAGEKPQENVHVDTDAPIVQVSDSQIAIVMNQIKQLEG